jgi:hypothetical protein
VTTRVQNPVAMFLFNRPDTTAPVFAAVRRARPARLLLIADGPRPDVPSDDENCARARALVEAVDWECEVMTHFSPTNLGLKRRMETGLDWVFAQAETAIILEDDCLPSPDFFTFCDALLARYQHDPRILSIAGSNCLPASQHAGQSYYLSRYPFIWGWATWRRAWQAHDPHMAHWPAARDARFLNGYLDDPAAASYWAYQFETTLETQHTWDYAWTLSCWLRQGLCIVPAANLVSNIGYGPSATHTRNRDAFANLPLEPLAFPLRHPAAVERDAAADAAIEAVRFSGTLRRLLTNVRARVRAERQP